MFDSIDPNQSRDFHPAEQLFWMADEVGEQYEIVIVVNMCSKTMLLTTFNNKRLCFAMTIYL